MSCSGEFRAPVDERTAVEGGEEPLVWIKDERVSLFDAGVLVAYRSGKDSGSPVRAVDVEPPTALLRNLSKPGQIVDDAGIGGARRADESGGITHIGIAIERCIHRIRGQPVVRSLRNERIHLQ
jgi:hypothetical protein